MTDPLPGDSRWRRPILAAILLLAVATGARGLRDNASVMLSGDMARYLMDGVFVRDFIADGGATSVAGVTEYAERYYARYPALSLGHHPPLPYVALVPFYAVFGVSILGVRIAELCWFLAAAWGVFALGRRLFGWQPAAWATALFVTHPLVLRNGQRLLSEMPMMALVLLAFVLLIDYCDTRRTWRLVAFGLATVASLYAKQLAAFMLPVYALIYVNRVGWRLTINVNRHRAAWLIGVTLVLVVPIVLMTIGLARGNAGLAFRQAVRLFTTGRHTSVPVILQMIAGTHFTVPLAIATLGGLSWLLARRDGRAGLLLTWIACSVGGTVIFAGGVEPARYAYSAIPAYVLASGALMTLTRAGMRAVSTSVLVVAVAWQIWITRDVRPTGAGGYEQAAEFVVANARQPVVMYDSGVDTGYFVFFTRAHDPSRRMVILRADKILFPVHHSGDGPPAAPEPGFIHDSLQKYGVQFVVTEERRTDSPVLLRLHDELKTAAFIERLRIPVISTEPLAAGLVLVVYEFRDAQPADPDATLDINLPLGGREFKLPMRELLSGTALRSR